MQFHCSARKWTSSTADARMWMATATDFELPNNRSTQINCKLVNKTKISPNQKNNSKDNLYTNNKVYVEADYFVAGPNMDMAASAKTSKKKNVQLIQQHVHR